MVGRIVAGAALVDDLAAMPAVKAAHGNPFFKCALWNFEPAAVLSGRARVTDHRG